MPPAEGQALIHRNSSSSPKIQLGIPETRCNQLLGVAEGIIRRDGIDALNFF